jgi:hypothetical protein
VSGNQDDSGATGSTNSCPFESGRGITGGAALTAATLPTISMAAGHAAPGRRGPNCRPVSKKEKDMKKIAVSGFMLALLASAAVCAAQAPQLPTPEKAHQWLQQLVGEWEAVGEAYPAPGQPPMKIKGTESVRSVGGFWVVAENRSTMMDMPFTGVMTLGYDPERKKYVGTWLDSMSSYLWTYEGTVDSTGKTLTLETEGPCPMAPGRLSRIREVIELKGKDQKVFTSSVQAEDGKWVTGMTLNYRRKK